jgi:catechol 2,3-dioxygenase-like lactoylglutathione lyase family enzyme
MFNHIMVGSNDIERSKRFYDAVLGVLGAGEGFRSPAPSGHQRLFYRHNGGTIAFKCESAEQVKTFHDVAVEHGGQSIEEPPGLRDSPLGPMHLAYVRDPDGNKLCAVYRLPKAA